MNRYYVIKEFFGLRVYDSKMHKEYYYDQKDEKKVLGLLANKCIIINNYNIEKSILSSPLKISMNITKNCNLRCIQCFSSSGIKGNNELQTNEFYELFDNMKKYGTFFICLGGGEPFIRNDIFEILDYGSKNDISISVVTNSLLLNKDKIMRLNDIDLDFLWVSFEGGRDNHDRLRGKGTFDMAISKLKLIKEYYKGKTAIRMSINKNNIDDMMEILRIAEENNIDLIRFTPLLEFGRAKEQNLFINQDEYIDFLTKVKNISSNKIKIIYPNMKTNKFWINAESFGCHCGKEAIWIDEEGNVSPCIFWGDAYNVGNIRNSDYLNLWRISNEVSCFDGNKECINCSNYKNCRGGCRARALYQYGSLNDIDPLCPLKKTLKKEIDNYE